MDGDKIKDFFIFHVEKMILVVVFAATGFMLYSGFQLPNYLATHDPEKLGQNATTVREEVDENRNEKIIPERVPDFSIVEKTQEIYKPVAPTVYEDLLPWSPPPEQSLARRADPEIVPAMKLMATGVRTAIAVKYSDPDYRLAQLEAAEPPEKIEKPVKKEPKSRSRGRRGGGGEEGMMMMMMEEEMMMMEEMAMQEMEMAGPSMAGGLRSFDPTYDFGVGTVSVSMDQKHPRPETQWFIAGTALLPHRENYDNFEKALHESDNFSPTRDTPFYYNFEVQRADVTDKSVDELKEEDWIDVWNRKMYTLLADKKWATFAPEVVPDDYRDPHLTTWIPPVLLDDYRKFALHPDIPLESQAVLLAESTAEDDVAPDFDATTIFEEDNTELRAPGDRSAGGGMFGMEGGYDDMYAGMEMGMGSLGFRSAGIERNPVQHKLLRFYDFRGFKNPPQPGKQYVYRVRYSVNDPNFPANPRMQPKVSSLNVESATRVLDKMAEAEASGKRTYERWSEWSEPSNPVSLAPLEEHFAGPVMPASTNSWTINNREVTIPRSPAKARIVTSQYSDEFGTRVPMRLEVSEGSVLAGKEEVASVVDQLSRQVKALPNAELVSDVTVVGLGGGEKLSIVDELTEPGSWLLMKSDGSLEVTDEIADQEMYRIHSYADERGE